MATNKKRVLVPDIFGMAGLEVFRKRDDVEVATFPGTAAGNPFRQRLQELGEVNAVALGGTPFGRQERDGPHDDELVCLETPGIDSDGCRKQTDQAEHKEGATHEGIMA